MRGKTSADGTKSCLQMQMNTIKTRFKFAIPQAQNAITAPVLT